ISTCSTETWPSAESSCRAESSFSPSTSHNEPAAPERSARAAMAYPIPRAAPVITATRSFRSSWFIRRSASRVLRRDRGDRPDLDVAVEHLRALGLQDDRPGCHRRWKFGVDARGAVQPHHDLAVDDVYRVLAERDQLQRVPFAGRLLVVRHLHAAAGLPRTLREVRP